MFATLWPCNSHTCEAHKSHPVPGCSPTSSCALPLSNLPLGPNCTGRKLQQSRIIGHPCCLTFSIAPKHVHQCRETFANLREDIQLPSEAACAYSSARSGAALVLGAPQDNDRRLIEATPNFSASSLADWSGPTNSPYVGWSLESATGFRCCRRTLLSRMELYACTNIYVVSRA